MCCRTGRAGVGVDYGTTGGHLSDNNFGNKSFLSHLKSTLQSDSNGSTLSVYSGFPLVPTVIPLLRTIDIDVLLETGTFVSMPGGFSNSHLTADWRHFESCFALTVIILTARDVMIS